MTPFHFEQTYQSEWTELEMQLAVLAGHRRRGLMPSDPVSGERVAVLYRRACEHLALARARSYPALLCSHLTIRLAPDIRVEGPKIKPEPSFVGISRR